MEKKFITFIFYSFFIIISFKVFDKNRLVKSINLLLFNIKSRNLIQNYPYIVESCAGILYMADISFS